MTMAGTYEIKENETKFTTNSGQTFSMIADVNSSCVGQLRYVPSAHYEFRVAKMAD